jgi:TPR repeat protein
MSLPFLPSVLCLALLMPAACVGAALPAAWQAELDVAVIDYQSGRRTQARRAFEALSRRGVAAADYNLAVMHLKRELPQASQRRAEQLLTRSARGGFVTAQLMLAQALETGDFGRRDLVLAHQWYEVAAESGSAEAQLALGTAYYLGRGRPKDPVQAAHWFRETAKAGDVGAMYLLASQYEQGDGVERNLRLARYGYDIAARNGDEAAPGKVKELDARLQAGAATAPL